MKTISKIEQEINEIRLAIYEETKDMTPSEMTEYFRKSGKQAADKYGFKRVASARDVNREQVYN